MNSIIKQDQDRLKLFKKYGYDITKAKKYIIAKAGLSRNENMLEVGTGRGHMATALASNGFKFTSIDLDKKGQDVAKIHLKEIDCGKSVSLRIMNAEKLQYKDNHFSHVISVNFIHHAKNPVKCLKEMIRVTKNKLVIADINKRGERIMQKVHKLSGHSHASSKISLEETEALLKNAGMKVNSYKDTCQTVIVAKKGDAK